MHPVAAPPPAPIARTLCLPGWLFTGAVLGFLLARRLLREGLFGDGLTYAAIARNMAEGRGTFWQPFFSHSFWLPYNQSAVFYDHPPLMFGLQAWFFRWLGDTPYTEKVYCAVVIGLTAVLIVLLWKRLLPLGHPLRGWGWLPLLAWYSFRTAEWCNAQNLLDGTMTLFCLLSVWAILTGLQTGQARYGLPAVLALMAGFLTKGPVSLHVLAVPLLYTLVMNGRMGAALAWTVALSAGWGLMLGLLLSYEPAGHFLYTYTSQQIWAALTGKRETLTSQYTTGRFFVVQMLAKNALPLLVAGAGLSLAGRFTGYQPGRKSLGRVALFWLVMSLAAVLPMMASVKQYEHYILPALPYLALSMALWLGPILLHLASLLRPLAIRVLTLTAGLLMAGAGVHGWQVAGTIYPSDQTLIEEVRRLGQWIPAHSHVGVTPALMADFTTHSYLQRYHRIELTPLGTQPTFALTEAGNIEADSAVRASGYRPLTRSTRYAVWRR